MEIWKEVNRVQTKEDFLRFLDLLIQDYIDHKESWENKQLDAYLLAMRDWIEDCENYYKNTNQKIPENINWNFMANVLYAAKIYE